MGYYVGRGINIKDVNFYLSNENVEDGSHGRISKHLYYKRG